MSRAEDELSLIDLVARVLRRRRLVMVTSLGLGVLTAVVTLLWPRHFTVSSAFLPDNGGATSTAATLAAKFGLSIPSDDPSQSPAFYGQLLGSDDVIRQVVTKTYRVPGDSAARSLVDLLDVSGDTEELRIERAISTMGGHVHISIQPETGVVGLDVTTDWPNVSYEANQLMLDLVNQFNRARMHGRASAERTFMQDRVDQAGRELQDAEDALEQFLTTNRQYAGSPELTLEHDRLGRMVSMRQDVFTSLVQALDNSRLDEARNTPLITIVEPPRVPGGPDRRHLALKTLLALVVGGTLGVGLALVMAAWQDAAAMHAGVSIEVADMRMELAQGVRRILRLRPPRPEQGEG